MGQSASQQGSRLTALPFSGPLTLLQVAPPLLVCTAQLPPLRPCLHPSGPAAFARGRRRRHCQCEGAGPASSRWRWAATKPLHDLQAGSWLRALALESREPGYRSRGLVVGSLGRLEGRRLC